MIMPLIISSRTNPIYAPRTPILQTNPNKRVPPIVHNNEIGMEKYIGKRESPTDLRVLSNIRLVALPISRAISMNKSILIIFARLLSDVNKPRYPNDASARIKLTNMHEPIPNVADLEVDL